MSNYFKLSGKYTGIKNRRTTPGGVLLADMYLSAEQDAIPWKQSKVFNVKLTVWGDTVYLLEGFKSGDMLEVEGLIEAYREEPVLMINKVKKMEVDQWKS